MPISIRLGVAVLGIAGGVFWLITKSNYFVLSIALIAVGILAISLNFWIEKHSKR